MKKMKKQWSWKGEYKINEDEKGQINVDTSIYLCKYVCFDEEWNKMKRSRWRGEDEDVKRPRMYMLKHMIRSRNEEHTDHVSFLKGNITY